MATSPVPVAGKDGSIQTRRKGGPRQGISQGVPGKKGSGGTRRGDAPPLGRKIGAPYPRSSATEDSGEQMVITTVGGEKDVIVCEQRNNV